MRLDSTTEVTHSGPTRLGAMTSILAVIVAAWPGNSLAYSLRYTGAGAVVHWQRDRIPIRLDTSLQALGDEDVVFSTLIDAVTTWEESGLLPPQVSLSTVEGAAYGFRPNHENTNDVIAITGDWPFSDDFTAVTISTYDADSGALLDTDIVFNANRRWSAGGDPGAREVDLLDVATHEIGHLLGLDHSEDTEATMYSIGPMGSTGRRSLHTDDLEALTAAYGPPPALGRSGMEGCSAEGRPHDAPLVPVLAVLVVFCVWRRR